MKSQQSAPVKAGQAGPLGLDSGSHRLKAHEQPLPFLGHAGRIRGDERQRSTSGEGLSQAHFRVDSESLGGERHLADPLSLAGLRRQRRRLAQQLGPVAGGHDQLEAR